jgi:hypothetical protein
MSNIVHYVGGPPVRYKEVERAVTSASNFYRRVLCPGSEWAELYAPPDGNSKDALAGTILHDADANDEELDDAGQEETRRRNQKLRDDYIKFQLEQRGIPLDARRKDVVEVRYFLRLKNGGFLLGIDGKPLSGQPDRIVYFPEYKLLFVFDSKFGRIAVERAETNYQLRLNAVMVAQEFNADTILAAITQPWATPDFHAVEYDKAAIRAAYEEILAIWQSTKSPDAPRYASLTACRHCRAKIDCKLARRLIDGAIAVRISEMPVTQLEELAPRMELAKQIIDAYWERLEYIATNEPAALSKFRMKDNSPIREVAPENIEAALTKLEGAGLIKGKTAFEILKMMLPKIENIVAKSNKLTKQEAKERVEAALGDLITLKPKKPSLVEV